MRPAHIRRGDGVRRLLVLAAALVVTACGSAPPPSAGNTTAETPAVSSVSVVGTPTVTPVIGGLNPADAQATYGRAPTPDPSITYQPDVVFIGGGPAAIRWASDDGLVWAIDASAAGAADLKVGSVMFATTTAVGRVAAIADQGDTRVVTIAPIQITDLVKDGDLQIHTPVNLAGIAYRQLPADAPAIIPDDPGPSPSAGADTVAPDGTITVTTPGIRLATARRTGTTGGLTGGNALDPSLGGKLTVPAKICPEVGVGDWVIEGCWQDGGAQLTVDRKVSESGLKLGAVLKLTAPNLRLDAGTIVKDGQMVNSGGLLQGLDSLEVRLQAGVSDGAQDNTKIKVEVPVEIEVDPEPIPTGIPWKVMIEVKFSIETAFSGKNSTLKASGKWKLSGPVGVKDGSAVVPGFSTVSSILDSLSGITIGPSGLVVAIKWKFQGGVGVPGAIAGPYVAVTFSLGVGRGSVLGASLAECKGATLAGYVTVGAGYSVDGHKLEWLLGKQSVISKYLTTKLEVDVLQFELFNKKAVTPDVPLCRG